MDWDKVGKIIHQLLSWAKQIQCKEDKYNLLPIDNRLE